MLETYCERKKELKQIAKDLYEDLVSKNITYEEFRVVMKYLNDLATTRNDERPIS